MSWLRPGYNRVESVVDLTTSAFGAITVTASSTPHVKGSWAELIASTGINTHMLVLVVGNTASTGADTAMLLDIGVGGAGSETVLVANILAGFVGGNRGPTPLYFPLAIPAGSRIALRCQSIVGSATAKVQAHLFGGGPFVPPFTAPATTYGVTTATSRGTTFTSGTANVKGSWAEIVASTTRPIKAIATSFQGNSGSIGNVDNLVDVGVGAAGSEVVLLPNLYVRSNADETVLGAYPYNAPLSVSIPVGSRLAVRCQTPSNNASSLEIAIHGFG